MGNKIKILHLAKPLGGVGTYIELLDRYIDKEKFENIITYNKKEDKPSKYLIQKKQLFDVNLIRSISVKNDIQAIKDVYKIIKNESPDIIHCHSSKAGIIGRIIGVITGIPTIYTPHSYYYIGQKGLKKKVFKSIEKIIQFISKNNILACSQSEMDRTIKELKIQLNKVKLWTNSIPKPDCKIDLKSEERANYICSMARPSTQKNLLLALKAFRIFHDSFPDVKYYIIGVGHYSNELKDLQEYIKENNLDNCVQLMDWMEREETIEILKNAKFYLSTSIYEGLPYSLLESLSLGVPIIATDCDGNKDLVDNNSTGFLVGFEENAIAAKMKELYGNTELSLVFRGNSLDKFRNFDIHSNINILEDIYKNLV